MSYSGAAFLKTPSALEQLLEEINFQRTKEMRQLLKDGKFCVVWKLYGNTRLYGSFGLTLNVLWVGYKVYPKILKLLNIDHIKSYSKLFSFIKSSGIFPKVI